MEQRRKLTCLTAFCLSMLVSSPLVEGGCQETIMQKPGFMECIMSFGTFFTNMNIGGTDPTDEKAIFQTICSEQGRAAFDCVFGFIRECPDLVSGSGGGDNPMGALGQIPGFDMNEFMQEGALDATCALFVGPCSKVQECFIMPSGSSLRRKRQGPTSTMSNYLTFQSQVSLMCGPMKNQMDCMMNALSDCPESVVSKVEAQFEQALNMSTGGQHGNIVSYKDTKKFIAEDCSKLPSDNTCLQSAFLSDNFTECVEDVASTYSKEKTCTVHHESVHCIIENVEPRCGKESAAFLSRNTHMIYPGIPSNCNDDMSGSTIVQTSIVLLLISSLLSLFL